MEYAAIFDIKGDRQCVVVEAEKESKARTKVYQKVKGNKEFETVRYGKVEFVDGDSYYDLPDEVIDILNWWFVEFQINLNQEATQQAYHKILELGYPCDFDMAGELILWNWVD